MPKRLLSLALVAIMAAMLLPAVVASADEWTMYVFTDNGHTLNVRRDPMTGDNIIGQLKYGEAVSVRMTSANGWATIDWAAGDGYVAYVQSRYLSPYKPAPIAQATQKPSSTPKPADKAASDAAKTLSDMNAEFKSAVKVSPYTVISRPSRASGWVNLRWAPTLEAERIATCPQGKELTVLAELKNWYQVQDPETGMIGFISRKFVSRK